jgi:hypothetical protein
MLKSKLQEISASLARSGNPPLEQHAKYSFEGNACPPKVGTQMNKQTHFI